MFDGQESASSQTLTTFATALECWTLATFRNHAGYLLEA
jgi:hypothetical protein